MNESQFHLRENEGIVKKCHSYYFPSSPAGISVYMLTGEILLTTHRILFSKGLEQEVFEFPLSKINNVIAHNLPIRGRYNTICIDFENGGSEFFSVDKPGDWIEAINLMRNNAPDIDYSTKPLISGTVLSKKMTDIYTKIFIIVIIILAVIITGLTFLFSIIQSK